MPGSTITGILGVLTILGQVGTVTIFLAAFIRPSGKVSSFFGRSALSLSFLISLFAVLGSLFYSEISGYAPCTLCWYQRILMYPQLLLFGTALVRKERMIAPYALVLSLVGAVIAGYHSVLQFSPSSTAICEALGTSVSCTEQFFTQFGYITIPVMSLTAFLMIAALMTAEMRRK